MRELLFAAPLALAACAGPGTQPGSAAAADRVPAATPIGAAQTCIPVTRIRETRVRSDQVIDFIAPGGEAYRVTLPQRCPNLGFEGRFTYATSLNQLCAQDIITVLFQAGGGLQRGASCGLAPFQPVRLADSR